MHIPELIDCPQGQWTLVATGVIRNIIQKRNIAPFYAVTYRAHGAPGPTNMDKGSTWEGEQLDVRSKRRIDVYVWVGTSQFYSNGTVEVFL